LLEVSPAAINFELRRQHGLSEGEAALVIREATKLLPRPPRRRTARRPQR
jgi:hypothetical protein